MGLRSDPWQHLLDGIPRFPLWVRIIAAMITAAFLAATAVASYRYVEPILHAAKARSQYAQAVGTILHAEVKAEPSCDFFGGATKYLSFFRYKYTVMGGQLYGRQYSFDRREFSHESDAQLIVRDHPEGSTVMVYYDPLKPTEAVLQPEIGPSGWYSLLWIPLLLMFALLGLWANVELVAMPRRLRRFATDELRVPWRIPGWGTMTERSGAVAVRRVLGTYANRFLCWYTGGAVACLLVVSMIHDGAEHARPQTVLWALAIAPGAALVLAAHPLGFLRPGLVIDFRQRMLTRHSMSRRESFAFDDVASWSVQVRPRPGRWLGIPPVAALQIALKDGDAITIRRSQPPPVARKLAIELAKLTGAQAVEEE